MLSRRGVAPAVREVVLSRPAVLSCLRMGIVNYSALARLLLPEIRSALGKDVSIDAIKMSLVRLSRILSKEMATIEDKVLRVIAGTALRLETDLAVVTVGREYAQAKLGDIARRLRSARFLQITQGVSGFTIVLSKESIQELIDIVGEKALLNVLDDQSAIVLISPKEIIEVPGVVAYITDLLAWRGINITQVISCYLDTVLILNRDDALKAYTLLEELISSARKGLSLLRV